MKCYNCENEATRKDYREVDGITGKVITCDECFNLNDKGIRDRFAKVQEVKEEVFGFYDVDNIIDTAMDEFWSLVNSEVDKLADIAIWEFEQEMGTPPHPTTVEKFKEKYYNLIQSKTKQQL